MFKGIHELLTIDDSFHKRKTQIQINPINISFFFQK